MFRNDDTSSVSEGSNGAGVKVLLGCGGCDGVDVVVVDGLFD